MSCLIVVHSWHHNNTKKVALAMADAIGARVQTPFETNPHEMGQYSLIGFGAGIDSGKHYKELLDFAHSLPLTEGKRCFIFSTCGVQSSRKTATDHARLRGILQSKGYGVVGEFSCKGYNTNSFLKYTGGMNKNRPNEEDLSNAKRFAAELILSQ